MVNFNIEYLKESEVLNMTIENKLKNYIMTRYSSLREFTIKSDIPYSTVNAILKRGIANSSLSNVSKICKALNISLDELEHNRIVPLDNSDNAEKEIELKNVVQYYKFKLQKSENIYLDDRALTDNEKYFIMDSLDIMIEQIRKRRERLAK
jgi:predicted transcriptional regulator